MGLVCLYVTSDIGWGTYNILTGPYGVTFDVRSQYDIIKVYGIWFFMSFFFMNPAEIVRYITVVVKCYRDGYGH